ncbi:hypothetical protein GJ496_010468 [Pomphorhynchus laevis]|nr:hypothetical protein GJ496_010468 [Pomphorhynchus laevis]
MQCNSIRRFLCKVADNMETTLLLAGDKRYFRFLQRRFRNIKYVAVVIIQILVPIVNSTRIGNRCLVTIFSFIDHASQHFRGLFDYVKFNLIKSSDECSF